MKDHKVVAMPSSMPEYLDRQRVNVADFARSQDLKEPPKLRRSLSRSVVDTAGTLRTSKSPGRKRLSNSRDLVQEVYDRMGVNYVRGQSSTGIYDSNGSISATSEVSKLSISLSSNVSRVNSKTFQNLSVDTRTEDDVDERKSCRSSRSVKSLMSAFGGGKSVSSAKSAASRSSFHAPDFVTASPSEEVREKVIDCRDDGDMDGTMSVISLESSWTGRRQQQLLVLEGGRRSSFQPSTSNRAVVAKPQNMAQTVPKTSSGLSSGNESIDRMIEEKLQAKIAELTASFEAKFRLLEEETNRRLEKMEKELKESSQRKNTTTYPYKNYRL